MKISMIGAGKVGTTTLFAILQHQIADELVIIDTNKDLAEGEAKDLLHATPFFRKTAITSSGIEAISNSDIVIISAGAAHKAGQTRLDLAEINAKIVSSISQDIAKYAPNSIVIVVTNPVDVMSYVAWKATRFSAQKILGSGTVLDSARLRVLLADHCGVSPANIHAHVIGEHGDSELIAWSNASLSGISLYKYCPTCSKNKICLEDRERFLEETREAGYKVIEKKGATNFAVAAAVATIAKAIANNEKRVLTVSSYYNGIFIGYPSVIGSGGAERILPIDLNECEQIAFEQSQNVLRKSISLLKIID